MRIAVVLAVTACFVLNGARAQEGADPPPATPDDTSARAQGDQIFLRSGRSLHGVRVLSETQVEVKVEVLPGLPPLILPASQVVSIRYETPPPDRSRFESAGEKDDGGATVLRARKMAPSFSKALAAELKLDKQNLRDADIVVVLEAMAKAHSITIQIGPAVRARPVKDRRCTLRVKEGQTLDSFLMETVSAALPWLHISYGFDQINVIVDEKNPPE